MVWRVSSHAIRSTMDNVSSALNVMSLRLPIGVDTMKSVPFPVDSSFPLITHHLLQDLFAFFTFPGRDNDVYVICFIQSEG